jgi:hypothetical protein
VTRQKQEDKSPRETEASFSCYIIAYADCLPVLLKMSEQEKLKVNECAISTPLLSLLLL